MELTEAIRYAMDGEAILFLGSGFSIGATNKKGDNLLTASELSKKMCRDLGIEESGELALTSERYIEDPSVGKGLKNFINFLKNEMLCTNTSDAHDTILSLPWKRIYTTNYDNIVEISSRKQNIEREVITATLPKKNVNSIDGAVIHMNGYIVTISEGTFHEEFKITNENYLKNGFLESRWADQFISDINNSKAIIFVGYSMKYDLDIQKVMHERIKSKAVFVDREGIDGNQRFLFSKWGTFFDIESKGLADEIKKEKKVYIPKEKEKELLGIEEIKITDFQNKKITPTDVINLLVYGKYDKYDFRNSAPYYLKREKLLSNVIKAFENQKICLIHSNLGNGKSIALTYLESQLIETYTVYHVKDMSNIQDDLNIIKSRKSYNQLIVVDNYDLHMSIFKELSYDWPDNIYVLAACRTSMSEVLFDRLIHEYGISESDISVQNIEIINDSERLDLIALLDEYNLWGVNATKNPKEKESLLNKTYKNRLSSVFYMLLDSEVIEKKINDVLVGINNQSVKQYILAQAICDICNFELRGYEIAFLADINYSEIEKLSLDSEFKELLMRTGDTVELRSTVFSQYVIRKVEDYEMISSLLVNIFKKVSNSSKREYKEICRKIISRSNLIEVFGGRKNNSAWEKRDENIYAFYCDIQNYAKENPFFWLQMGITSLNLGKYPDARIYFDNAYSYANELEKFDAFQLDTHYARFLLAEMLYLKGNWDFETFIKAHRLLMDNSNAEIRLSYVLRQVGIYNKIDQEFADDFSIAERQEFIECIKEINGKFEDYFAVIAKKKKDIFYFSVDKSVKTSYKQYRKLLFKLVSDSKRKELDNKYNKLVKRQDRVKD